MRPRPSSRFSKNRGPGCSVASEAKPASGLASSRHDPVPGSSAASVASAGRSGRGPRPTRRHRHRRHHQLQLPQSVRRVRRLERRSRRAGRRGAADLNPQRVPVDPPDLRDQVVATRSNPVRVRAAPAAPVDRAAGPETPRPRAIRWHQTVPRRPQLEEQP
jgi:hypothetical protein